MNTVKRNGGKKMSKNLIPEICKILGVELGENFKLDTCGDDIFKITESGLWMKKYTGKNEWVEKPFKFATLCKGDGEVVKLPWEPKKGDYYYYFDLICNKWCVRADMWLEAPYEYALLDKGWVYKTCEEAEAALPVVAKELGVAYTI